VSIYFVSDTHLGSPLFDNPREKEERFTAWLDSIKDDCEKLFLLGDIFDFWFEYKKVIPKGFTRVLGKLAEFTDKGIEVYFFTGNHDIWTFGYLEKEIGMIVYKEHKQFLFGDKRFYVGHGDGLNENDKGFLFIRRIFHNRFLQKCFRLIHPDLAIAMAQKWSAHSRKHKGRRSMEVDKNGNEYDPIEIFAENHLKSDHVDYFIFGHIHQPKQVELSGGSLYTNVGDWIDNSTYAVFDGKTLQLKNYF
jgi:UDP-2,3-diacylglucosamine hydrolase